MTEIHIFFIILMTGILIGWFLRANSVFIDGNTDELTALKNRVLLCSPLTLYTVLSLIYQPTRNFAMEEKAEELLKLLEKFRDQWSRHAMQMEKLGRNIESIKKDFELLLSTRSRQQKKPLKKIEKLSKTKSQINLEQMIE